MAEKKTEKTRWFWMSDARTVGRCTETADDYRDGQAYRDGEWKEIHVFELIHSALYIDREEAIKKIGLEAVEKE